MDDPLARAAREGAQMAVLPAGVGDLLAGIPVPSDAPLSPEALARRGGFDSWIDCVRGIAPVTSAFYVHTFESLARRHRMIIASGTIHLPGEYRAGGPAPVFNAAFVFGPGGEVCGEQRQTRPSPGDALGLAYGDAVSAFATAPARIGILIKSDFFERDLRAELLAQGAQVIVRLDGPATNEGGRSPQTSVWPARELAARLGEDSALPEGVVWPENAAGAAVAADERSEDGSRVVLYDVGLS